MNQLLIFPEGKTNYQIVNEHREKTTISLEKWVADVLQQVLNDVHAKIQAIYNRLLESNPNLTRRQRGDIIRSMAERTADLHQDVKKRSWAGIIKMYSIPSNSMKFKMAAFPLSWCRLRQSASPSAPIQALRPLGSTIFVFKT